MGGVESLVIIFSVMYLGMDSGSIVRLSIVMVYIESVRVRIWCMF